MKRALFIGNSFTYYHDLPAMTAALSRHTAFPLHTESVTCGGCSLHRYANVDDPMGQRLRALYAAGCWEYIILQDQSFNPVGQPDDFRAAVRQLTSLMNGGARFLLYQTWAYQEGSEKLALTGLSYSAMHAALREAYQAAADECGALLVPVGDAFSLCRQHHPGLSLYAEDAYHPSLSGAYLAACLFSARMTQTDPAALPSIDGLDGETARLLRMVAHDALSAGQPL